MNIPHHTRILVIADDDRPTREYGIGRPMVVSLFVLAAVFVVLLTALLVAYAIQTREVANLQSSAMQLRSAQYQASRVIELRRELEKMRSFQERLLTMLGVERPPAAYLDSLAPASVAGPLTATQRLQRAASVAMAPPPDLWPARGFVTREFIEGQPARGIKPHTGIDIAGPTGSPVVAAGDGVVFRTGEDPYLGNFVEIQHGLGYLTVYGHCSSIAVARGDRVARGQVVAHVGDSGQASAPHLHFEIWNEGEVVDPRDLIAGDPPHQ
jgi:murein DD-endopeptidase MepM/ murein hydrolase activator NlpD